MRSTPMAIRNLWNRRTFLGSASVLAGMALHARRVLGFTKVSTAPTGIPEKLTGFGSTGNVYEELGVTTVITGQGTMTYLRGSLPRPEADAVTSLRAQHFFPIGEWDAAARHGIGDMLTLPGT